MSGRLAENIAHFARALRAAGLPLGPGAVLEAIEAAQAVGIGTREEFYWTLHAVFVKKREHSVIFDQAFRIFWRRRYMMERFLAEILPPTPATPHAKASEALQRVQDALFSSIGDPTPPQQREVEIDARLTLSDEEVLRRKDFAQMSAEEIARARDEIRKLALPLAQVKTRRLGPDPKGRMIDMRRTLRASMSTGGSLIELARLGRREKAPPLVVLVDISGSMSQYSQLFLHFVHAITDARKRVHSFVFGTRLTNISRALRAKDPDLALADCSKQVVDWSGGTRIATSLANFNRHWARRVLGQGAVVLLITDGLERDADGLLEKEIDRLHRSCRRLVWLNPLLRFDGFEAKARGIRALLPHVDEFRPIHNLSSMASLCRALEAGGAGGADPKRYLKAA